MNPREFILQELREKYRPRSLILYGSYARGDQNASSDFDCLLITDSKERGHDDSVIAGVMLDCFIFTVEETLSDDLDPFLPICEGLIVYDDGVGAALKERVCRYVEARRLVSEEDKLFLRSWIRKTLRRSEKDDEEGRFRAVSLLAGSLEDYCSLRDRFYFGSKRTIAFLKRDDPDGYTRFRRALFDSSAEALRDWAEYVIQEN